MKKLFALIFLGTFLVAGKITDDDLKLGKPGTSDDVSVTFEKNQGASNPKIVSDGEGFRLMNAPLVGAQISGGTISGAAIDQGAVSATNRLTVPVGTDQTIQTQTRKPGTVYYSTNQGAVIVDDGTNLLPVAYVGGGVNSGFSLISAAHSAVKNEKLLTDSSAGSFAITLPAVATLGDTIEILDGARSWSANPVTVTPPTGVKIRGESQSLILNLAGQQIKLVWINESIGWQVF